MDTKNFIRNFNFPNPDWSSLPEGFPMIPKTGLTTEEKHLIDAIKIAWLVSQPPSYFVRRIAYQSTLLSAILIIFTEIIMFSYWANVEYNLGIKFLTDFFA